MPETAPPPPLTAQTLDELARWAESQPVLPVDRWHPPFCGDSAMRIARDGTWFHEGVAIARPAMVRLFARLLRREGDDFFVVTPAEKLSITVDCTPFTAVELRSEGEGADRRLAFRLNTDDIVFAGAEHPLLLTADPPLLRVRTGLDAALARPVYYELVDLALADAAGLWAGGVRIALEQA